MDIKEGDIIKKKSGLLFSTQEPTMIIDSILPTKKQDVVIINKFMTININDVEIIDVEEYDYLNDKLSTIVLSDIEIIDGLNPCVSSVSNEEKIKYYPHSDNWKQALWRMKYVKVSDGTEGAFEAYLCPSCKFIHIGKNPKKMDSLLEKQ
jgi:hypothetical protein